MSESFKWSPELKSKEITIDGSVITRKTQPEDESNFSEFCLTNKGFSKALNKKQSWKIKINKKKGEISVGIALKNKMQSYNFTGKNITWTETGHGMYMNDHDGCCNSHSEKEFNCEDCGLEYDEGDVITVEYVPFGYKIRFIKNDNEEELFEMPIEPPSENNAYHPCVELYKEGSSVELLSTS